nr:hypothetical protein [Tanacetum cinerariifolium]
DTAGVEFGQNPKNLNYINFGSSVVTEKSNEVPRSSHNKENLVNYVDNNYHYNFDCSSVPTHRQARTVVDNHNHNVNHSGITRTSKSRTGIVEGE